MFLGVNGLILSTLVYMWSIADEDEKQALLDMDPTMFARVLFLPGGYKIPIPQELSAIGAVFGMMFMDSR